MNGKSTMANILGCFLLLAQARKNPTAYPNPWNSMLGLLSCPYKANSYVFQGRLWEDEAPVLVCVATMCVEWLLYVMCGSWG